MTKGELRAIVFASPYGKLTRFIPSLEAVKAELEDLGLYNNGEQTLMGRIAHLCACEINPKRAFYRKPETLFYSCRWFDGGTKTDQVVFNKALDNLLLLGILEEDTRYKRGRAVRIKIDAN